MHVSENELNNNPSDYIRVISSMTHLIKYL